MCGLACLQVFRNMEECHLPPPPLPQRTPHQFIIQTGDVRLGVSPGVQEHGGMLLGHFLEAVNVTLPLYLWQLHHLLASGKRLQGLKVTHTP